jgi:multimeric flavodoxin WrbA
LAIIGIGGSPIVEGNRDRIIKAVLEQSAREHALLNLSMLTYAPCRACAHLCATTNLCALDDDLKPYFELIRDADAWC